MVLTYIFSLTLKSGIPLKNRQRKYDTLSNRPVTAISLKATILVFPPAPKKGMVNFQEKGTLSARKRAKRALLERAATGKEGTFQSKFLIEFGIVIYKFMSLSILQLLSVLFKCKIYYLFNYYLEFSNQF